MWWTLNPERLRKEVIDIDALRDQQPWLVTAKPRIHELKILYDFDIRVNGNEIPLRIDYPAFFPDTPPAVSPRDGRRLTGHQYGSGGELCLEFRSDNWDPSYTGAMLIQSAYKLLSGENPSPDQRAIVASAHQLSTGQKLRGSTYRFLLVPGLLGFASTFSVNQCLVMNVRERIVPAGVFVAHVDRIGSKDSPAWTDKEFPVEGSYENEGILLRVESLASIPTIPDHSALQGFIDSVTPLSAQHHEVVGHFAAICDASDARLYYTYRSGDRVLMITYETLILPPSVNRLPNTHSALSTKKVGIVGCGSLGSKIAVSLGRCGVRHFVLIDSDLMMPGNLVRNELSGESIGAFKVDAIAIKLKSISKELTVNSRRVSLGEQEASGTTTSVLDSLAECDLLIDSTGNPKAFNFVAAVARNALRSMIWCEVFAGGIGGLVVRLRPNVEPHPHAARQQCLAWCRAQQTPWLGNDANYETTISDQATFIADDGDVAIIAAQTAKMAVDVLASSAASRFPHPAYMIGFSKEWIFTQPFDIFPIDLVPSKEWRESTPQTSESVQFLESLLSQVEHES